MKNISVFLIVFCGFVFNSQAALVNTGEMMLTFGGSASADCVYGGTFPDCTDNAFTNMSGGSYFLLEGVGTFISSNEGIVLGTGQPLSTSSNITNDYTWLLQTDTSYSDSPISALSDTQIDMSGWSMRFSGANMSFEDGVASISCGSCNIGDSYVLGFASAVPVGDPSGLGGFNYELHLEGTILQAPLPAAAGLFIGGLFGLRGVAVRKSYAVCA